MKLERTKMESTDLIAWNMKEVWGKTYETPYEVWERDYIKHDVLKP